MSPDDPSPDPNEEGGDGVDGADPSGGVIRRDRFSGGPARSFLSSMDHDERIFGADLAVDRAHVVMLAERDILASEEAGTILRALDDVEDAGFDALAGTDAEDVHEAIESAVIGAVGPVGGKLHTARSRNDEVSTCIRYRLREDVLGLAAGLVACRETLLERAEATLEVVMPGYTHLQPAQPTTVAHWLAAHEAALARDTERLLEAYARINRSPLGAAAFAGTPFDVDRERTASLLGFDGLVTNAMDAASTRDFLLETLGTLAGVATTLSGVAEDVVIFASRGFLELDDAYASTSSIMPQKKNPDSLELVRATTGEAHGALAGALSLLKGLPRAYNRDLQRATPLLWRSVDAVGEAVDVTAGAVGTATWDRDALAAAAGEGFATATGVADLLAMHGVPFRTAHEAVATAALERADGADAVDVAAIEAAFLAVVGEPLADHVDPDLVEVALDPFESVRSRDSVGGPAPARVAEAVEAARDGSAAHREAVATARGDLEDAEERLARAVSRHA